MNGNEFSGIFLFKVIVSKSQVYSQYAITLLLGKLTTEMADIMASFGNNIYGFNKEIWYIGTELCARGEDPGNLLPQLFKTYYDCSTDNGPFTCYIEILENQYNDGTLNLEYKDIMDNSEVEYNNLKDKIYFNG